MRWYVRVPLGVVGLAAATVAVWWSWLGRDHEYQYEGGRQTGPFEAWQVVGCVLCLAVLAFMGGALLGAVVAAPVTTVAFTTAWVAQASSGGGGDGLWPVGAVMVFVGLCMGSAVMSLTGQGVRALARARTSVGGRRAPLPGYRCAGG